VFRPSEAHLAGTYLGVQVVFHPILLVETGTGAGRLGPKIRDGVRATKLKAYQVVDLELASTV